MLFPHVVETKVEHKCQGILGADFIGFLPVQAGGI
jgi:hypothetical protein